MRLSSLLCLTVLITGVIFSSFADDGKPEKTRYVKVTKHQANIFTDHTNPQSPIVRQTKQGEYLRLVNAGESWLKVIAKDAAGNEREGFLEARNGKIVNSKIGSVLALIMTIIVLLGCAAGIFFYIKKQKSALS